MGLIKLVQNIKILKTISNKNSDIKKYKILK